MLRTLLLACLACTAVQAQSLPDPEEGAPHAVRLGWDDYRGHSQNWAIAQSPRGLLYVANTLGVVEYDGADWRLKPFGWDTRTLVRSLAVGASGTLYVGGIGELGRLKPDSTQTLAFESLMHAIPASARDFSDVWSTHATSGGIVFQTPEYLFRWTGRRMQVWKATTSFHLAFLVNGRLYVREDGVGLRELEGDRLPLVPGGEAFATRRIFALMPHPSGLLAATRDEGLWTLGPGGAAPMESPASMLLREVRPYAGFALSAPSEGMYAVATLGGGVVVINAAGRIIRVHREDVGLQPDDFILGMAPDRQGGLWLALLNGIVRLDFAPRLTEFGSREGLTGVVYAVERHAGRLYVGTSTGVFRLVPGRSGRPGEGSPYSQFELVPIADRSSVSQAWSLLSAGGDLLVAANEGLFHLRRDRLERLTDVKTLRLGTLPGRSDIVVGEKGGLRLLRRTATGWTAGEPFAQVDGEISSFVAMGQDTWVGLMEGGVLRVTPRADTYEIVRYGPADGLARGPATVVEWGAGFRVIQQAGVRRPVETGATTRFERDPSLAKVEGQYSLFSGQDQQPWLYQDNVLAALSGGPGAFEMRMNWAQIEMVSEDATGVVWIGTNNGLYRYDPRVVVPPRPFPAFIRRVTDVQRRTLYGGAPLDGVADGEPALVLPYATNSLRFEYAAAAFSRPEGTEYQFRLVGLEDDQWSPWGPERSTNYTQLFEGTYTFHVRARDAYGDVGETASFTLRILPPWYRTLWAYLAYLIAAVGLVWGFTAWRLHKQRVLAEAQRARNARLSRLGARLREANARLRRAERLKDDLLANTSHELRTPLTAVMGYSEMLLDEIPDEQRDLAEGIHRGGVRLLGTVNGLLDMYKLQSGTLDVFPETLDVGAVARDTIALLMPLARTRGLTLRVVPDALEVPAVADRSVIDRILTNLVGNAIKFTDTGGVDVLVDANEEALHLTVRDTGIGIPADMVERVFEPFEQVSTGHARSHEGTGLGLTIVHRLVDLMGGTIAIESTVGVGTAVRVTLPRYAAAQPAARIVIGDQNTTLAGAHVFAFGLPDEVTATLAAWLPPSGRVLTAEAPGAARRLLRRTTCDAVLLEADEPDADLRRVRQLRRVPGYAHTPVVRVGGEPLPEAELATRGFTHQLSLPLDIALVVPMLEQILSRVESDEEAATLAP